MSLLILGALLPLAVAEGALRIAGYGYSALTIRPTAMEERSGADSARLAPQFTTVFDFFGGLFAFDREAFWLPVPGAGPFNEHGYRGAALDSRDPADDRQWILCLGDSNTLGWTREEVHWPAFLEQALGSDQAVVINAGVHGHSSYQGLRRLRRLAHPSVDLYLLSYGATDGQYRAFSDADYGRRVGMLGPFAQWRLGQLVLSVIDTWVPLGEGEGRRPRVSLDAYRGNLEAMLDECASLDAACVLLTRPFLQTPDLDPVRWSRLGDRYNDVVRRVAAERSVPMIDVARSLRMRPELFGDDSHLTPEGYRIMAKQVREALEPSMDGSR